MNIRPLQKNDFTKGFLETLENLRSVGIMSLQEFEHIFDTIRKNPTHFIFVAEENDRIVGTITLLIEQKFIRKGGKVGHIEDVTVHVDFQNKGIGKTLVEYAVKKAREEKCYKTILNCSAKNAGFYEKAGFKTHEIEMRQDL